MFAAGLVKYGVAHYNAPVPRKDWRISTPARPTVTFESSDPVLDDPDADLPLQLMDMESDPAE